MDRAELLLPAGNIEKMKYAIAYGADAVYLGTAAFSLRSPKAGNIITDDNLKQSIETAHNMGAKAYVTLNVFADNEIIKKLPPIVEMLQDTKPDGIIFADAGLYPTLSKKLPDVPLHISTQANVLNYETVKFWRDLGAKRVILARELSVKEISKIHQEVPEMELEVLVHGSVCVAYSGRCLLSDYMTNNERKANQGNCSQPCRWPYSIKLSDSRRPNEEYEILEDEHASYVMNPKDLALIEYIPELIEAGVCSLKIEGRTKSLYYASLVAKAYRKALDAYYEGKSIDKKELYEELMNAGNRGFSNGFIINKPNSDDYNYVCGKSRAKSTFQAVIIDKISDNQYRLRVKNQMKAGESFDVVTPKETISTVIDDIQNEFGEKLEVANTNSEVIVKLDQPPQSWEWGIIRHKEKETNSADTKTDVCSGACN